MKDHLTARKQRGEITENDLKPLLHLTDDGLIRRLGDPEPQNRTAAARLLGERRCVQAVDALCARLRDDPALYARLAAGEALAAIGEPALPALIALLGKIGHNRHAEVPSTGFYKKSFPLPRDLAARVIIRVGEPALPYLEDAIRLGSTGLPEAVDAAGHIAFYSANTRSCGLLLDLYNRSAGDALLRWKLVRAFQAFPMEHVRELLEEIIQTHSNPVMRCEALRSLSLHGLGIPEGIRAAIRRDIDPEVLKTAGFFLK